MNSFERFCFNLLGKRMKGKREEYAALRNDLISARFKTPFEVYLSTAFISAIIVGLSGAVVIGVVSLGIPGSQHDQVHREKCLTFWLGYQHILL